MLALNVEHVRRRIKPHANTHAVADLSFDRLNRDSVNGGRTNLAIDPAETITARERLLGDSDTNHRRPAAKHDARVCVSALQHELQKPVRRELPRRALIGLDGLGPLELVGAHKPDTTPFWRHHAVKYLASQGSRFWIHDPGELRHPVGQIGEPQVSLLTQFVFAKFHSGNIDLITQLPRAAEQPIGIDPRKGLVCQSVGRNLKLLGSDSRRRLAQPGPDRLRCRNRKRAGGNCCDHRPHPRMRASEPRR